MNNPFAEASSTAVGDGDLRGQLNVIMQDLRGLGRQVKRLGSEQLHAAGDRAKAMGESVGGMVKDRPLRSVLIAVGVGALVGLIWGRR